MDLVSPYMYIIMFSYFSGPLELMSSCGLGHSHWTVGDDVLFKNTSDQFSLVGLDLFPKDVFLDYFFT